MRPVPQRQVFTVVFGLLIAVAWITLWLWQNSPYGRYLNHAELGAIAHADGATPVLTQASLYVFGWLLMTTAMMLPTTLPLLDAFRRMTAQRADHHLLVALVSASYLGVWLSFGILAHLFDYGLHEAHQHVAWLQANAWVFGAGPLFVAGLFQFSRLKYRCLDRCRAPAGFIFEHWRGGNAALQAMAIGAHHGAFCVGCCWALMLLMFAVGVGNVGWMLLLGAIMAIEKNMSWGRRLSAPLGVALLLWAGLIVLNHGWSWQ